MTEYIYDANHPSGPYPWDTTKIAIITRKVYAVGGVVVPIMLRGREIEGGRILRPDGPVEDHHDISPTRPDYAKSPTENWRRSRTTQAKARAKARK